MGLPWRALLAWRRATNTGVWQAEGPFEVDAPQIPGYGKDFLPYPGIRGEGTARSPSRREKKVGKVD